MTVACPPPDAHLDGCKLSWLVKRDYLHWERLG